MEVPKPALKSGSNMRIEKSWLRKQGRANCYTILLPSSQAHSLPSFWRRRQSHHNDRIMVCQYNWALSSCCCCCVRSAGAGANSYRSPHYLDYVPLHSARTEPMKWLKSSLLEYIQVQQRISRAAHTWASYLIKSAPIWPTELCDFSSHWKWASGFYSFRWLWLPWQKHAHQHLFWRDSSQQNTWHPKKIVTTEWKPQYVDNNKATELRRQETNPDLSIHGWVTLFLPLKRLIGDFWTIR